MTQSRTLTILLDPNELALRILEITNNFVRQDGDDPKAVLSVLAANYPTEVEAVCVAAQVSCSYFHEVLAQASCEAGVELNSFATQSDRTVN